MTPTEIADHESRRCPACDGRSSSSAGSTNGYEMVRCAACHTLHTARIPTGREAHDYAPYYGDHALPVPGSVRRRLDELVADRADDRVTGRWLDVGCGAGTLLRAALAAGWSAAGTEVSGSAIVAARAEGLDVLAGELQDLDLAEGSYDVVTVIEVLEHVPVPAVLLVEVARLLRPGGVLYATTPHGCGISARLLGTRWSVVAPPEHLQLFSTTGLKAALTRAGLEKRWMRTHAVEPRELLAGLRRAGGSTSPADRVTSSYQLSAALSERPGGELARRVANALLSLTQAGDTLKVLAQRPV